MFGVGRSPTPWLGVSVRDAINSGLCLHLDVPPNNQVRSERACLRNDGAHRQYRVLLVPLGNKPGSWPPDVSGGRKWNWEDVAGGTRKPPIVKDLTKLISAVVPGEIHFNSDNCSKGTWYLEKIRSRKQPGSSGC